MVPIGRDGSTLVEVLFVVQPSKDNRKSRAVSERNHKGRKESTYQKSKKNSPIDYFKRRPTLTAMTVLPGSDDLSKGDCPFVMKRTASHCHDLVSLVAKLGAQQRDVPAMGEWMGILGLAWLGFVGEKEGGRGGRARERDAIEKFQSELN